MQRYRTVIILLLLVVLPLAAALVAARFLLQEDTPEPVRAEAPPPEEPEPVAERPKALRILAVARDLPVGALLTDEDLLELEVAADEIRHVHVVVDGPKVMDAFRGYAVREPLPAGTPIVRSAIVGPGQRGFLAAVLMPGKRAMTIQLGAGLRHAGLIDPGDRVDVILTAELRLADGGQPARSRTILEDVRVVAVDHQVGAGTETAEDSEQVERTPIVTATLEVSPAQADRLALGEHEGSLSLAIRSLAAADRRAWNETVDLKELLSPPPPGPETHWVLSAARALPAGTLLQEEDLSELELKTEYVGREHFVVDGITSADALRGFVVREALGAGVPFTRSAVVGPGQQGFLATVLKPGTRAVTIRPGAKTNHDGLIDPGDRVDVILTAEVSLADGANRVFTRTILEDVRVVAVDRRSQSGAEARPGDEGAARTETAAATLEVSPAQADLLAHGGHEGVLSLAVRSPGAMATRPRPTPEAASKPRWDGGPKTPAARLSVATDPVLAPRKTVRIIRGGELTEQIFYGPGAGSVPEGRPPSPGRAPSQ